MESPTGGHISAVFERILNFQKTAESFCSPLSDAAIRDLLSCFNKKLQAEMQKRHFCNRQKKCCFLFYNQHKMQLMKDKALANCANSAMK